MKHPDSQNVFGPGEAQSQTDVALN
jgi:hypothetical protein